MLEALEYPFFRRALVAGLLASVACGVMGTWVVVRRIASISGGVSHAAFGGVGLGYLCGFDPMLGATGFALGAGAGVGVAYRRFGAGLDTLIAMVWSLGMALGILFVHLRPGYPPDLMSYLFGSILLIPPNYIWIVLSLDIVIVALVALFFRELRAVAFDEEFARVMRLPVERYFHLLLALTSLAVVTLIRIVGVILVIALLTVPAAVARQWQNGLLGMMVLASAVAATLTTAGLFLTWWLSSAFSLDVPTGPVIIVLSVILYGISGAIRSLRGDPAQEGAA
jgi:zinc transport system permease protein